MESFDHPDCLGGPHFDRDLFCGGRMTRLHKGASVPKQTKSQKQAERLQLQLLEKQLNAGEMEMPEFSVPEAPPAPPPAAPPASISPDTTDAEREARRKSARRLNSGTGTIFAGETGGYSGAGLGGKKTILG